MPRLPALFDFEEERPLLFEALEDFEDLVAGFLLAEEDELFLGAELALDFLLELFERLLAFGFEDERDLLLYDPLLDLLGAGFEEAELLFPRLAFGCEYESLRSAFLVGFRLSEGRFV